MEPSELLGQHARLLSWCEGKGDIGLLDIYRIYYVQILGQCSMKSFYWYYIENALRFG